MTTSRAAERHLFRARLWAVIGLVLCTVAVTMASLALAGMIR